MNARNLFASFLALTTLGLSAAVAGPTIGTAKARGDYRGWNATQSQRSIVRSQPTYQYRAPAAQASPMIVRSPATASPAPQLAEASPEGRRFSYTPAPENAAVAGSPCAPQATTAPQTGRRYSYAPSETAAVPAISAPRAYSGNSGYSQARSGSSSADRWALPKTDPRKFND